MFARKISKWCIKSTSGHLEQLFPYFIRICTLKYERLFSTVPPPSSSTLKPDAKPQTTETFPETNATSVQDTAIFTPKPYKPIIEVKGMVFDSLGNVKLINEDWKKADLCTNLSVFPRDLRKLDPTHQFRLPAVLIREKAIIVNLGHIRAVIQADQLVVFDSGSLDHGLQSILIHELQGTIGKKQLPFELKALEAILINVVMKIDQEEDIIIPKTRLFLKSLDDYVNQEKLKMLISIRRELANIDRQVDAIRSVLNEILNNDEDLAGLYVSDKISGKKRDVSEHMEAELLLEHYSRMVDEISDKLKAVISDMNGTEAVMHIVLDKQRNNLILFDLKANLITLAVASGTFLSSLFGMNLMTGLENTVGMFWFVGSGCAAVTFFSYRFAVKRLLNLKPGRITTTDELGIVFRNRE